MDRHAGIFRDAAGLDAAATELRHLTDRDGTCLVAAAVVAAATARTESIGCHQRSDAPGTGLPSPALTEVTLDAGGVPAARMSGRNCVPALTGATA